jgi:predicted nucleic acid-binding protein
MATTYLIDTNILVYAYNEDVEFHEKALKIIEDALNKNINAVTANERHFKNIKEISVLNPFKQQQQKEDKNEAVDSLPRNDKPEGTEQKCPFGKCA